MGAFATLGGKGGKSGARLGSRRDGGRGRDATLKRKACHSVEPGKNGIGPSLAGIWGEKAGAVPGFEFSDAMKSSGLTWNQATLDRYLTDPRGVAPRRMAARPAQRSGR